MDRGVKQIIEELPRYPGKYRVITNINNTFYLPSIPIKNTLPLPDLPAKVGYDRGIGR
jgi:hypothetical protein